MEEVLQSRTVTAVKRWWAVALLGVTIGGAAVVRGVAGVSHLPLYQVLAFPVVILAFSQVSLCGIRPPRFLLAGVLLAGLLGAVFSYSNVDLADGAFVVAQFEEDELARETKIFRDRVRKVLGWRGLTIVGTHTSSVRSFEEAARLLRKPSKLSGVIYGNPRWLTVALREHSPVPLFPPQSRAFCAGHLVPRKMQKLQLITSVPGVGLSTSAEYPTVEFLGRLAGVWRDFVPAIKDPGRFEGYEGALRALAGVKGKWTAFSHRALPMWMSGTYHLVRVVQSDNPETGELICALNAFEAAASQLRPGDNPELTVAVLNNLAMAYMAKSYLTVHRTTERVRAKELLQQALQVSFAKNPYPITHKGVSVAEANLKVVRSGMGAAKSSPTTRKRGAR